MRSLGLLFLSLVSFACTGPSLDDTLWSCRTQADCGAGYVCSSRRGACIKPESNAPGVTAEQISVGLSAPLAAGPVALGRGFRDGVEAYFSALNAQGGADGRQLKVLALDDGYDPSRAEANARQQADGNLVLSLMGGVGSESAAALSAVATEKKLIYFGAPSGSPQLRRDPPDRYVFNLRSALTSEATGLVGYLTAVRVPSIPGPNVAVLVEADANLVPTATGQEVAGAVTDALRELRSVEPASVALFPYPAETTGLSMAVGAALKWLGDPDRTKGNTGEIEAAIVLSGTYGPASAFIRAVKEEIAKIQRGTSPGLEFGLSPAEIAQILDVGDVSFAAVASVGSDELYASLKSAGLLATTAGNVPYCQQVIASQVVPPYTSNATGLLEFRDHLRAYSADATPSFSSLEGYLAARLWVEGVLTHGPSLTIEGLVDTFDRLQGVDFGVGTTFGFSPSQHQATNKIWAVNADANCAQQPLDLGDPGTPPPPPDPDGCEGGTCVLTGTLTEDTTLTADKRWLLRGTVFVGNGTDRTVLIVQPGTVIAGEKSTTGALVVRRGSQIRAVGSRDAPIVFTSDQAAGARATGDWGGIIINGNAPLNVCDTQPCESFGEGGTGFFGGSDEADDSGELRYVRIEFGGKLYSPDNELNGLALQAVGSGTEIDYIQIHLGQDDGIEFFGGTVNVKHILVTGADDDSMDWTDGWRGKAQFIVLQQYSDRGDNGIEADNNETTYDATPLTRPTISNLTAIGSPESTKSDDGMQLRRGTGANLHNAIVVGFNESCVNIDDLATWQTALTSTASPSLSGDLTISRSIFSCAAPFKDSGSEPYPVSSFVMTLNEGNLLADPLLTAPYSPTAPDFRPMAGSPAMTGGVVPNDPFFDNVTFRGGVDPANDWTVGWTTNASN
jgi:ABC-type branched-subunit amino acid transport system substrate-binding protein